MMRGAALAVVGMALLAACGVPAEHQARQLDAGAATYRAVTREAPQPPVGTQPVAVFLVRDNGLVSVQRRIAGEPTPERLLAVLEGGPSDVERAGGFTSGLSVGTQVTVTGNARGLLTLSLRDTADSRSDAVLGYGQLVLTLTQLPSVAGVRFEKAGQALQVPRADGSLSDAPLTGLDYRPLLR